MSTLYGKATFLKTAGAPSSQNQTLGNGGVIIMPTVVANNGITYNTSTGIAVVQSGGLYDVRVMLSLTAAVSNTYLALWVNGSKVDQRIMQNNTSVAMMIGSAIYPIPNGASLYITNDSGTSITLNGNIADCIISIHKVQ
jgi:hypothetical protein